MSAASAPQSEMASAEMVRSHPLRAYAPSHAKPGGTP